MKELIKDADVVVSGYRPGAMERNGFGQDDILEMVKDRERGIIYLRENCYGHNGPWKHRSGWQQISDSVSQLCFASGLDALLMSIQSAAVYRSLMAKQWVTTKL